MIQEDLSGPQEQEESRLAAPDSLEKPVSAEERYRRHGHTAATFLLENQAALASKLERALFDQGFEVSHLESSEASADAFLETIRITRRIGVISIYSGAPIDGLTKKQLSSELKHQLFDLSRKNESASDEAVFRHALALADSLRFGRPHNHQEEVQ
jgi:hypothetical protein